MIYIDYFSGSVADLKNRQKGDSLAVLEVLDRDPNVSTWDMDDNKQYPLWKTINDLESRGLIVSVDRPYPWLRYEVTDAGKRVLAASRGETAHV